MPRTSTVLAVLLTLVVGAFGKAAGVGTVDAIAGWWRGDRSSATVTTEPVEESLERAAETLNANLQAVAIADERFDLKSVKAGPGLQLRYDIRAKNISAPSEQQMLALLVSGRRRVCGGRLRSLMNRGVAMRYRYGDDSGRWVEEHVIRSVDCEPVAGAETVDTNFNEVLNGDIAHASRGAYSLDELVGAYRRNELTAATTFESGPGPRTTCIVGEAEWCRYFDFTGTVGTLTRDQGAPVIGLLMDRGAATVSAFIANRDLRGLPDFEPGSSVTLRCLVIGGAANSTAPGGIRLLRCSTVRYRLVS